MTGQIHTTKILSAYREEGRKEKPQEAQFKQFFVLSKTPFVWDRGEPDTLLKGKNLPL